MVIKKMTKNEIKELWHYIEALAEYHNNVSEHFNGMYPMDSPAQTIEMFEEDVENGRAVIYTAEEGGVTQGFIKADINKTSGAISYLFVDDQYRGEGIGDELTGAAMTMFKEYGVKRVDVKVVYGSPTVDYYEKHGFKKQQYIMTLSL